MINISRRHALAATAGLPFAVAASLAGMAVAEALPVDTDDWDAALAAYRSARLAYDRACDAFNVAERTYGVGRDHCERNSAEERMSFASIFADRHLHVLIDTPAPSWAAVIEKSEILAHEFDNEPDIRPLIADMKRLAGVHA